MPVQILYCQYEMLSHYELTLQLSSRYDGSHTLQVSSFIHTATDK